MDDISLRDLENDEDDITGDYDARNYDRQILLQHDLSEKLITDESIRRSRKKQQKKSVGFAPESSYRRINDQPESDNDIEVDAELHLRNLKTKKRRLNCLKGFLFSVLCILILSIFGAAVYVGVLKNKFGLLHPSDGKQGQDDTSTTPDPVAAKTLLSNGTTNYYPTTICISLDGFRPDYLTPELTPAMWEIFTAEYSAPFMYPSFPSVTFPNHYTLATGLYPSAHGIVGNTFFDPVTGEEFDYHNDTSSLQPKWWGGEPVWATATKNGLRTGVHMWPGSEVPWGNSEPEYVDEYNGKETLTHKVDRVLNWLDEDFTTRPELIMAYVPTIDSIGHKYGTSGPQINQGLVQVDGLVSSILDGIVARNLSSIVNVVVVSDHGMASTSNDRIIFLDDIISLDAFEHTDGWPLFGLRPFAENTTEAMYNAILQARDTISTQDNADSLKHWQVYTTDTMPAEYHFAGSSGGMYQDRIAPIWLVPEPGWTMTTHARFKEMHYDYHPKGLHGFNNTHPLMRALFIATGPHFPAGTSVEPFYNVELYDILCKSLGINGAPNNGTMAGYPKLLPENWIDPYPFGSAMPDSAANESSTSNESDGSTSTVSDPEQTTTADAPQSSSTTWMAYFEDRLNNLTSSIDAWLDKIGNSDDGALRL
ncbi:alkaline-phosphatase-like protein [Lipomyces arxii]|uniref:alkaline-phosphatase-like protein n=1 Tax=Lipomyces arxii TaxID=56418 RepID=UPI0034CFCA40